MLKRLEKQLMQNMKRTFTLIELIVVIVVIGVLAAIVVPNISSFKEEASTTAMVADGRNIQTSVDMFQLKNDGTYPVKTEQPTIGKPQEVNFNSLNPDVLRDLPQFDSMYYWIDYQGQVWFSTIDNPLDFEKGELSLTWTPQEGVKKYTLYEVEGSTTSASNHVKATKLKELSGDIGSYTPEGYNKNKMYLISVKDNYGFEAAPVIDSYEGSIPFKKDDFVGQPSTPDETDEPIETEEPVPTEEEPTPTEIKRDWIAAGEQKNVVSLSTNQTNSQITPDGKIAVWQDLRNGNSDIYGVNLETNQEFVVINSTVEQSNPQITPDGKIVVWQDLRNGNWDIYGKNLETNKEFLIVNAESHQREPQITPDGRIVVWTDFRVGNYNIYGKNLETNQEFVVVHAISQQTEPQITPDGKTVIWTDYRSGNYDIYGKNLETNQEFIISNAPNSQSRPQISDNGKIVIWQDYRNNSHLNLYGKNLETNQEFMITGATGGQQQAQISADGNIVTWQDSRSSNWDIYGKKLSTNQEFVVSNHHTNQQQPQITPDGKLVIYSSAENRLGDDIVVKEISNLIQ